MHPRYCMLWSSKFHHSFIFKRRLEILRNKGVCKLLITSTSKQCVIIGSKRTRAFLYFI